VSRVMRSDPARPETAVVGEIAQALTDGQAVVCPTETQYGLLLRADVGTSLAKLNRIKNRIDGIKPALFVASMESAASFCDISPLARKLAKRYLPGPLTLVLPPRAGQSVVPAQFQSEDGYGIRISSSPLIASVMHMIPFPATATSANISGDLTPQTIDEIIAVLGEGVGLYVDGGPCRSIIPSTVAKVTDQVIILRHGVVAEAEIRKFLRQETAHEPV
jgi:L-threonylcarbamoyladenylate synthase